MAKPFSLIARIRSIGYAVKGLTGLMAEPNCRVHAAATVLVIVTASLIGVSRIEWAVLVIAMAMVWVSEALNTALERLADAVSTEYQPLIGQAKDIAAAAVLLAAVAAVILGGLVFIPHLLE